MTAPARPRSALPALAGFFAAKLAVGFIVTIASARWLAPEAFAAFTQLLLFTAWLALVATGGAVNGLVRQLSFHADSDTERRRALSAALAIWGAIAAALLGLGFAFAPRIAVFLVGNAGAAATVMLLPPLAAAAGLGQLLCGVLTARGRAGESMAIQTIGLIVSGAGSLWYVLAGAPEAAVLAFAAGPALVLPLALLRARPAFQWNTDGLNAQMRVLLAHSAAHFTVATLPALMLFAARSRYQEAFGLAPLGLWLLANRVSDLNSQLAGLYGAQVALPALSAARDPAERRAALRRSLLVATAITLPALAAFVAIGEPLMRAFLPPDYLAAAPFVAAYLLGDIFRAVVFTAMITMLSRNRYLAYAGIELAVVAAVAVTIVVSAGAGFAAGPAWAYPACYALAALATGTLLLRGGPKAIARAA